MKCTVALPLIVFVATATTTTEKHPKQNIESIVSTTVYKKKCVVVDSATKPLALLSTLLYTPQYLTDIDPPAIEYCGPLEQGNDP